MTKPVVSSAEFSGTARSAIHRGCTVVLIDDISPSPSSGLVIAAEHVTTTQMATIIQQSSGFVEICMDFPTARRLGVPPMSGTDFLDYESSAVRKLWGVAVDAAHGITTGISAADRANTARVIATRTSTPEDLVRPGHLMPVLIPESAIQTPRSLVASAIALVRAAGCGPAAVCSELVSSLDPAAMAGTDEAEIFARADGLPTVRLSELGY